MIPAREMSVPVIFSGAVRRAEGSVLYEGLPHQTFEARSLEVERLTKAIRELDRYPFYSEPLALAGEDAHRLSEVFSNPGTYQPFLGETMCGGFHPDYAMEWHTGGDDYRALICFGCQEVKLFGPGLQSRNNLNQAAYKTLQELLKGYQKNRPPRAYGR